MIFDRGLASAWGAAAILMLGGCGTEVGEGDFALADVELIDRTSSRYSDRIGGTLSGPREGRFLDDGRYVVILDRYPPYLHLFTADGDPLWKGGEEGDGPGELPPVGSATSLATQGERVIVAQRGRLTLWRLEADTLALEGTLRLPPTYLPQGLVDGCEDGWLLYGREEARIAFPEGPWLSIQAPELDFLHSLRIEGGEVTIEPLWGEEPLAIGSVEGNQAALIGRTGDNIVVHHRPDLGGGEGQLLEFKCEGSLLRAHDERALVTGEGYPVHVPRPRSLGTTGTVALESGFLASTRRWYAPGIHGVDEYTWQTEIFHFREGRFQGSTLVPGQWLLLDYHPAGGVLMGFRLDPHFIRVPTEALLPGTPSNASP